MPTNSPFQLYNFLYFLRQEFWFPDDVSTKNLATSDKGGLGEKLHELLESKVLQ